MRTKKEIIQKLDELIYRHITINIALAGDNKEFKDIEEKKLQMTIGHKEREGYIEALLDFLDMHKEFNKPTIGCVYALGWILGYIKNLEIRIISPMEIYPDILNTENQDEK